MTKEQKQQLTEERYPIDKKMSADEVYVQIQRQDAFAAGLDATLLTPSADVQERAKEYADKVMPFVWPKNKRGEDMVQPMGTTAPPFSAKHRREQRKIIDAHLAGASSVGGMQWVKASEVPCKTKALPDIIITLVDGRPFAYDVKNNIKGLMNVLENRPDCLCLLINKPQP